MNEDDIKPFSVREIRVTANTLANIHKSGGDMERGTTLMSRSQPKHKEFWTAAHEHVLNGGKLSVMLAKVWPRDIMTAVEAGESTGTLGKVYVEIRDACKYTEASQKTMKKLIFPAVLLAISVVLIVCMLAYFLPMIEETFPSESPGFYIAWGIGLREFIERTWLVILLAVAAGIVVSAKWLADLDNRLRVVDMLSSVPHIGIGLRMICFAKFSRYMSIMHASGSSELGVWDMMRICSAVLPPKLREPINEAANQLEQGKASLTNVFSDDDFIADDNASSIPSPIIDAFINGGETGNFEQQLAIASGILEDDGKEEFEYGVASVELLAKFITAIGVGIPAVLYAIQMTTAATAVTKAL